MWKSKREIAKRTQELKNNKHPRSHMHSKKEMMKNARELMIKVVKINEVQTKS